MIERSSGILMPVFSLPSKYGIGTLGKEAYEFVDFLAEAGQTWWQILPLNPTSFGDSPYQSFSTNAGNPYFIDLDELAEKGLLDVSDLEETDWGSDPLYIDYGTIYNVRFDVLKKAYLSDPDANEAVESYKRENPWAEDYALFMSLKKQFDMVSWLEWPDEALRKKEPSAVEKAREELKDDISFFIYLQYLFDGQWLKLKEYANEKGIKILGDLPIYVALDSADVWANPDSFILDEDHLPTEVAGVPPDAFSDEGQLWGNPLYNWDHMAQDGYGWWIRRIERAAKWYDAIRIDHFRGFDSYWAIPFGETTAINGEWVKGPGYGFIKTMTDWFHNVQFIAEDLGVLTDSVRDLLKNSGLPGMKVLEFAFDPGSESDYLPHNHIPNSVCYIGTHDNDTALGWKDTLTEESAEYIKKYVGINDEEGFVWGLLRAGMSSVSGIFIAQIQDYLELGSEARINIPSTLGTNWIWRADPGYITEELTEKIHDITKLYGRLRK